MVIITKPFYNKINLFSPIINNANYLISHNYGTDKIKEIFPLFYVIIILISKKIITFVAQKIIYKYVLNNIYILVLVICYSICYITNKVNVF